MHTRVVLTASAIVMGLPGLVLQFAPAEVLAWAGAAPDDVLRVGAQVTGALLLGFAMINWMSRGARIGGIYGRPLATANVMHFVCGSLALVKQAASTPTPALWGIALAYTGLAVAFSLILMTDPLADHKTQDTRLGTQGMGRR